MTGRVRGGDPTPGKRRSWNEARGVTVHLRALAALEARCALLDGRPAVVTIAGQPVCAHHATVLAEMAALESQCPRRFRKPRLTKPHGRVAA